MNTRRLHLIRVAGSCLYRGHGLLIIFAVFSMMALNVGIGQLAGADEATPSDASVGLAAPQELAYDLTESSAKDNNTINLKWYPGEWHIEKGQMPASVPNQKAEYYEVQRSAGHENWTPVMKQMTSPDLSQYVVRVPQVPDGVSYFRVVAVAGDKKVLSPELMVAVFRPEYAIPEGQGAGRVTWDSLKDPAITLLAEKKVANDKYEEIGRVPSADGKFESDKIAAGEWLRWTALKSDGDKLVLLEARVPAKQAKKLDPPQGISAAFDGRNTTISWEPIPNKDAFVIIEANATSDFPGQFITTPQTVRASTGKWVTDRVKNDAYVRLYTETLEETSPAGEPAKVALAKVEVASPPVSSSPPSHWGLALAAVALLLIVAAALLYKRLAR